MKPRPTPLQRFFAGHWPVAAVLLLGAVAGMGTCTYLYWPSFVFRLSGIAWFALCLVLAGLIGALGAIVIAACTLPPLFRIRARINGAPFEIGDEVLILRGTCRDRVARVYEIWEERGQLRLDLGEQEREEVKDVFSIWEVCRLE